MGISIHIMWENVQIETDFSLPALPYNYIRMSALRGLYICTITIHLRVQIELTLIFFIMSVCTTWYLLFPRWQYHIKVLFTLFPLPPSDIRMPWRASLKHSTGELSRGSCQLGIKISRHLAECCANRHVQHHEMQHHCRRIGTEDQSLGYFPPTP